jgi:small subunit ribosomal protein S21
MLIIKKGEKESIDKVLKRYKKKCRETRLLKDIRNRREYVKPSEVRRKQLQQAKYKAEKARLYDAD